MRTDGKSLEATDSIWSADGAKRLECAGFSRAVVRADDLEYRMIFVRVESGAEATAVQTLREWRHVATGTGEGGCAASAEMGGREAGGTESQYLQPDEAGYLLKLAILALCAALRLP